MLQRGPGGSGGGMWICGWIKRIRGAFILGQRCEYRQGGEGQEVLVSSKSVGMN